MSKRKMLAHLAAISCVISGVLYVAQNCGPRIGSEIKTLDNFASGARTFTNQCSAPFASRTRKTVSAAMSKLITLDIANKHPLTVAVHDTLTAVPDAVLMWAMRHQATVIVSPRTAELCSAAIPDQDGIGREFEPGSLASCFVYFPWTSTTREILNFNVASDVTEVQHALLRTIGSSIAQLAPEISPEIYPSLLAFQKNIARAFVADLLDKNQGAFNIGTLTPFLGQFDRARLEGALVEYRAGTSLKTDPLALFTYDEAQTGPRYAGAAFAKKRFLDFVFAEAFDSYFCNDWGEFNETRARAIARGDSPLADSRDLVNTRKRLQVFFPRTHRVFAAGIGRLFEALDNPTGLSLRSDGFGLAGGRGNAPSRPSRAVRYESPFWAGTKAFFGSIYEDTAGRAANAYGRYTNRVATAVDNYYDSGGRNVLGAVAQGVGGGVAKTYEDEVAAPIREQTERRFDVQMRGGASPNAAAVNAILLAVGDQTGATPFLEGAYGVDTTDARLLSGTERAVRVAQGGVQLVDTAAGVGGFVGIGKAGTKAVATAADEVKAFGRASTDTLDVANAFNNPAAGSGLWQATASATAGPQALQATRSAFTAATEAGLAKHADEFLGKTYANGQTRLESFAAGMAEDATATTLKKGDKLFVVTDATKGTNIDQLTWGADRPPHPDILGSASAYNDFVNEAALPPLKDAGGNVIPRTNARVIELEITADAVPAVKSTVQANFGGQGGISQTLMAYNRDTVPGTRLFKVVGDTADANLPVSVYSQYDEFLATFDAAAGAAAAKTEAFKALDATASQAARDWGVLAASNQAYQGVGDTLANGGFNDSSTIDPFVEPEGSAPDSLASDAGYEESPPPATTVDEPTDTRDTGFDLSH